MALPLGNRESMGEQSMKSKASSTVTDETRPEDLSDSELLNSVEILTLENHQLNLENDVLEKYLVRMDPILATGLPQLLEQAVSLGLGQSRLHATTSLMIQPMASVGSFKDSNATSPHSSHMSPSIFKFSAAGSYLDKGPRVNVTQKMEMVARVVDDIQRELVSMKNHSERTRASLRAQLEERKLMLQEVMETGLQLEYTVVQEVDSLTGRVPAEKFTRHMEEWLKGADSTVEKLRLRSSTLRFMNKRTQLVLQQKEELGESLHPVDFEQLQIENKDFLERIEQKNFHLLELKKMTGKCSLQLNNHKKNLLEQLGELHELQVTLSQKMVQVKSLQDEGVRVYAEVDKATEKYDAIRDLISNYTVPDVMEYINKKAELDELRKAVKVWERRKKIQQTVLTSCTTYLQQLPGRSKLSMSDKRRMKLPMLMNAANEDME